MLLIHFLLLKKKFSTAIVDAKKTIVCSCTKFHITSLFWYSDDCKFSVSDCISEFVKMATSWTSWPRLLAFVVLVGIIHSDFGLGNVQYEGPIERRQRALEAVDLPCGSEVMVKEGEKYMFDSRSAIIYESSLYIAQHPDTANYDYSRRKRGSFMARGSHSNKQQGSSESNNEQQSQQHSKGKFTNAHNNQKEKKTEKTQHDSDKKSTKSENKQSQKFEHKGRAKEEERSKEVEKEHREQKEQRDRDREQKEPRDREREPQRDRERDKEREPEKERKEKFDKKHEPEGRSYGGGGHGGYVSSEGGYGKGHGGEYYYKKGYGHQAYGGNYGSYSGGGVYSSGGHSGGGYSGGGHYGGGYSGGGHSGGGYSGGGHSGGGAGYSGGGAGYSGEGHSGGGYSGGGHSGGGAGYSGGGAGYSGEGHPSGGEGYSSGHGGYTYNSHGYFQPMVCEWTYFASENCSLESHIIYFKPGDMDCYKQQFIISDNYTDFTMCGYQTLYPGFMSETSTMHIKYWRIPYTYRHVFKGYVTCGGRAQRPETSEGYENQEYTHEYTHYTGSYHNAATPYNDTYTNGSSGGETKNLHHLHHSTKDEPMTTEEKIKAEIKQLGLHVEEEERLEQALEVKEDQEVVSAIHSHSTKSEKKQSVKKHQTSETEAEIEEDIEEEVDSGKTKTHGHSSPIAQNVLEKMSHLSTSHIAQQIKEGHQQQQEQEQEKEFQVEIEIRDNLQENENEQEVEQDNQPEEQETHHSAIQSHSTHESHSKQDNEKRIKVEKSHETTHEEQSSSVHSHHLHSTSTSEKDTVKDTKTKEFEEVKERMSSPVGRSHEEEQDGGGYSGGSGHQEMLHPPSYPGLRPMPMPIAMQPPQPITTVPLNPQSYPIRPIIQAAHPAPMVIAYPSYPSYALPASRSAGTSAYSTYNGLQYLVPSATNPAIKVLVTCQLTPPYACTTPSATPVVYGR